MKRAFFSVLCTGMLAGAAVAAEDQTLKVEMTGVQHDRGTLRVGLYKDPQTFSKEDQALSVQEIPAQAGVASVRFGNLPVGWYAILAYHDEDSNGELNRRFGMFPTEGYALSNNPEVMGPPDFEDSAFEVVGRRQSCAPRNEVLSRQTYRLITRRFLRGPAHLATHHPLGRSARTPSAPARPRHRHLAGVALRRALVRDT